MDNQTNNFKTEVYMRELINKRLKRRKIINRIKFFRSILILVLIIFCIITIIYNNMKKNDNELNEEETILTSSLEENVIEVEIEQEPKGIDSKSTDWNLILVNKDNPIEEKYSFNIGIIEGNNKLDTRIIESARQMIEGARSQGLNPIICSSYRTNEQQTNLYNQKVKTYRNQGYSPEESQKKASYWVTNPRTSEHEIGLCMDIVSKSYQILDKKQEETELQKWLMEHCNEYGFILRYPTDKSEITKISYEPWHYRYVGIKDANFIKEKGLCLEEYIEYLKKYE